MARLKVLAPRLKPALQASVAFPPKVADPYYFTPEWKALRVACFERDGYICVVQGCGKAACVADHVVPRKQGGLDDLKNLRSLCRTHDNGAKENHLGERRGG